MIKAKLRLFSSSCFGSSLLLSRASKTVNASLRCNSPRLITSCASKVKRQFKHAVSQYLLWLSFTNKVRRVSFNHACSRSSNSRTCPAPPGTLSYKTTPNPVPRSPAGTTSIPSSQPHIPQFAFAFFAKSLTVWVCKVEFIHSSAI